MSTWPRRASESSGTTSEARRKSAPCRRSATVRRERKAARARRARRPGPPRPRRRELRPPPSASGRQARRTAPAPKPQACAPLRAPPQRSRHGQAAPCRATVPRGGGRRARSRWDRAHARSSAVMLISTVAPTARARRRPSVTRRRRRAAPTASDQATPSVATAVRFIDPRRVGRRRRRLAASAKDFRDRQRSDP